MRRERSVPEFVLENLDNMKEDALSKGYSMKNLSAEAGLDTRLVSGLKNGIYTPSRNNYNKLAVVLGWEVWQ